MVIKSIRKANNTDLNNLSESIILKMRSRSNINFYKRLMLMDTLGF